MKIRLWLAASLSAAAIVSCGFAATVSPVGVDETTNDAWRTSGVAKSLDADGDNIYGTAGYYIAQHNDHPGGPNDVQQPIFATIDLIQGGLEGGGAENHQSMFDDVTQTGVGPVPNLVAGDYWVDNGGAATGLENDFFSVTLTSAASFRLGVITDQTNNNPGGLFWEASRAVRITGPGVDTGVIDAVGPGEAWRNGDVDYVLFDITGDAGDVFTVWGVHDDRWSANALGGVFVDVPEPSISLLGVLGCLGLLLRRRR